MKTTLTGSLIVFLFATSLASFAATGESRRNSGASASTNASTTRQNECPAADESKKQSKEKKGRNGSAGEQEFERLLMAIYG